MEMENIKCLNEKVIEETFKSIGIKAKNQNGAFRNLLDIFEDLANLWGEITKGGDVNNEDYN